MSLRAYLVELLGTFLLVFCSAGTVIASYLAVDHLAVGLVGIAIAEGAVLAVLLSFTVPHSVGCLNPAVTLGLWVTRRFDAGRACALIAVQLIGAAFAGGLLCAVFNQHALDRSYAGTPHLRAFLDPDNPAHEITPGDWVTGSLTECVLTLLLTLALLNSVLRADRQRWGVLFAGLAMTACVLAGYHLSGASLNPARWFGTAVWQRTVPTLEAQPVLRDHLPYWMGPIVGSLLAAVVHAEWLQPAEKKA